VAYEVRCLAEPRVILITVWDDLTLNNIREGSKTVVALLDAGEQPLYVVTDITRMTSHPWSPTEIIMAGPFFRDRRMKKLIVFGVKTMVVRMIITVLSQVGPFDLLLSASMDESLDHLLEIDPTLAPLLSDQRSRTHPTAPT
jgi:hypothetical protein